MQRLSGLKARMLATADQQISLTDPDSRSMATSGRGSGVVGYNVQVAVDTEHHLIITHEVTNAGSDRAQLARVAKETKATLERSTLDVIADRGYFSSEEILECDKAGITVTLRGIEIIGYFGFVLPKMGLFTLPLVLLCHKFRCLFRAAQHGQRESVVARAATNLRRIVAIEFGTWRSGRNGGSSGLVTFAYGNLRAQRGGTIS